MHRRDRSLIRTDVALQGVHTNFRHFPAVKTDRCHRKFQTNVLSKKLSHLQ